jgi:hypothetical protein
VSGQSPAPRSIGRWTLDPDHVAVPDRAGARAPGSPRGRRIVATRGDGPVDGLPVYVDPRSSARAVATGRVFVRLEPGRRATGSRAALRRAGFEIEAVPAYAPFAAWVSGGGGAAASLARMDALRRVPGVEHVEPELLTERATRA